jgi:murein L,D-transpeptidase YafK
MRPVLRFALTAPLLVALGGCFSFFNMSDDNGVAPAERQLPASTQALLAIKGMKQESPIFVRIFKEESEFEVWKWKDGRFRLFRTYSICAWSGGLGPKVQQGDYQAPEGFYTVSRGQLNPHSNYYLAFNIGFPNAYDSSNGHTGSALMVHGNCKSAGCYAMTDAYIEEIYILAREAFNAGQTRFHVHAFPFRMTAENMARHKDSPWYPFWLKLKEGYDSFEATGKLPVVKVCSKQYMVNVKFQGGDPSPDEPCPTYAKLDPSEIRGTDGIPQTLIASLDKPEPSSATGSAPVVMAAATSQPGAGAQSGGAAAPDISASPVITRPAGPSPTVLASAQTKAPAWTAHTKAPVVEEADQGTRPPAGSQAQPVNYAPANGPGSLAAGNAAPSDDPNALQKLNRSGKGGKLSVGTDQPTDSVQAGASAGQ